MAVTNLYSNLPGHLVEFKDGGLQLTVDQSDVTNSKSLLILGTAFDGPVNEPVKIDATTVSQLFGSEVNENGYANGATLTKYAKQAFKNGFQDVRCMRVTGSQAYVDISKTSEIIEHIEYATAGGEIEGCTAFVHTLGHKPIVGDVIVKTLAGDAVSGVTRNKEEGTLSFIQNAISKNSTVEVTYDYKAISPIHNENAAAGDGSDFKPITLGSTDPIFVTDKDSSGQYIVDTAGTIPTTDGVVVKFGGTTLNPATDYTVDETAHTVTILAGNSANVTESDNVDIEYYTYVLTHIDSATVTAPGDTDQVITLDHEPKDGVIELLVNGVAVDASQYTVSGADVTLTAGNFNVKDRFTIGYNYVVEEEITEGITLRSIYGGSIYKEASIKIEPFTTDEGVAGCNFIFTKPASKLYSTADKPFVISSIDCPTVGMLKLALENYALNNVFEIITDNEDMTTANFPASKANWLTAVMMVLL